MNSNNKLIFYFSFLLFIFHLKISAQKKIIPDWITIEDGLSQGYISGLHQDSNGFLWIGTKAGLNKYDGREFKYFDNQNIDITSLQNEQIRSIKGGNDFVLIATEGDLYLFIPKLNKFHPFKLGFGIGDIFQENSKTYWIADLQGGFHKLTKSSSKHLKIENPITSFKIDKIKNVKINSYFKLTKYKNNILHFHQEGKFKIPKLFNFEQEKSFNLPSIFNRKIPSEEKIGYTVIDEVIIVYKDNTIYLGDKLKWKKVSVSYKIINAIVLPKKKMLVINTFDKYLFFDLKAVKNGRLAISDATFVLETKKAGFTYVLEDYSGNIWLGTSGYGLMKINQLQMQIEHYFEGVSIYAKPFVSSKGTVFLYNPINEENLLIPKNLNEAVKIKKLTNKYREVEFIQNPKDKIIWAISIDPKNLIIHKETSKGFKLFKKLPINYQYNFRLFDLNPKTNELVIALGSKLYIINLLNGNQTIYSYKSQLNLLTLKIGVDNQYWLGTEQGLVQLHIDKAIIHSKIFNTRNSKLQNNKVSAIHVDKDNSNNLWIGTKGGGLHKFDVNKQTITNFNTKFHFPDNTIYGILEDHSKYLWLSSNKGIIRFHKLTGNIKHFTKNDGLQGNEFNTFAFTQNDQGMMYFGGTNGLNIFNPKLLDKNESLAKAFLTEVKINNTNLQRSLTPEYLKKIKLKYFQNNLSFKFASTEFTAPFKNKFSYYLDGAEKEWAHTSLQNTANYLNIKPGNYTFKLKTSNNDSVWNEEFTSLSIQITPPWYKTTWAYGFYLLLFTSLIIGIIKLRENRINRIRKYENTQLENQLLETKILNKQKDLIDLANSISENTKWRNYLLNALQKIKISKGRAKEQNFIDLINEIKIKTSVEKNRIEYQNKIDVLNNEFYVNLLAKYPNLSKNELRLCSLLKLDLSSKEIAEIQSIELKSVYINRSRLRKKMGLTPDTDLISVLKKT